MLSKAQKSQATAKEPQPTCVSIVQRKARAGAGNRHRAGTFDLPGIVQRKLTIGKANDPFEREADRVANEVMQMSDERRIANLNRAVAGGQSIQRQCACGGGCDKCKKKRISLKRATAGTHESGEIPSSVHEVLRSSGQPLDAGTRAFMEPRFGYDFGDVRVHTNSAAARSAGEMRALAFTVGNHIAFAPHQYVPGSPKTNRLVAHELAHVVQQGAAGLNGSGPQVTDVIQRAGDPAAIPVDFACPPDLTTGRPLGADLLFPSGDATVTAVHDTQLTAFIAAWVASGGTDEIVVHGYASRARVSSGEEGPNWTLSCERAQNVRDALFRLGVPSVHVRMAAHGESTDFGAGNAANQHAVVSAGAGGLFSPPIVFGTLTALDDFAGRSNTRFGVNELIFLDFFSLPPRPAADFGGLEWHVTSGGGSLITFGLDGTGMYLAPDTAATVTLELRVASGPTTGRVVETEVISIVEPSALRLVPVPGSFPNFGGWGAPTIPAGTWGVGFRGDEFIDPKDVSFQGVIFGEASVAGVVTPAGSFLAGRSGLIHPANTHGPGRGGNITTGTPVAQDGVWHFGGVTPGSFMGIPTCGASDFLWAIPWEYQIGSGGARRPFAGGFVANQHLTSTFFCNATVEKAGGGPFCRRINGTTC